jgi:hypothetical protein
LRAKKPQNPQQHLAQAHKQQAHLSHSKSTPLTAIILHLKCVFKTP